MSDLKIAIARGPKCPNCGEDRFDDWWHEKTIKSGIGVVQIEGRLRCHGCGRFFTVKLYGDGEMYCYMRGNSQHEKPLFIPLSAKYFIAFEQGEKDTEYRPYGKRWNIGTCMPGRRVTLSYGYGKARRLSGIIVDFDIVGPEADPAIPQIYPNRDKFAAICIKLEHPAND